MRAARSPSSCRSVFTARWWRCDGIGDGPSARPTGGATVAASTPRGLFTTEVEQRVELHRLPSLFAGRVRAPGQRYDEVATAVRTSLATGELKSGGVIGTSCRSASSERRPTPTRTSRSGTCASGCSPGATSRGPSTCSNLRSEWVPGGSLHHVDVIDARMQGPVAYGRFRLGAADDNPVAGSDSAAGLSYRTWEGELSFGGRNEAAGGATTWAFAPTAC